MATLPSNELKELLFKKSMDFAADTFKIILMQSGFSFNRATYDKYADVSAFELPTACGYTAGGATLAGVSITRDDVNNTVTASWNNPSWLAAGGDIVTQGAIIINTTVVAPVVSPVVGYIDFEAALTTFDTGTFTVANATVAI